MSIALTDRAYAEFRRLRRRHASGRVLGPHWTILGSDLLFAALDLADIPPETLLTTMSRKIDRDEIGSRSPIFSRLLPHLTSCSSIRMRLGIVEIRCGSGFIYMEERHKPVLIGPGASLPEQVAMSACGLRLSRICDASSMPALASVDPIVSRARTAMHVPTGRDLRVEIEFAVGWRQFAPMPVVQREKLGSPRSARVPALSVEARTPDPQFSPPRQACKPDLA